MTTLFEWLFGKDKSPEELRREIEQSNEENYRHHRRKANNDYFKYLEEHKEIIEYYLQKPIEKVSMKEAIKLGFNSEHFTRKHLESLEELKL